MLRRFCRTGDQQYRWSTWCIKSILFKYFSSTYTTLLTLFDGLIDLLNLSERLECILMAINNLEHTKFCFFNLLKIAHLCWVLITRFLKYNNDPNSESFGIQNFNGHESLFLGVLKEDCFYFSQIIIFTILLILLT